MGQLILAVRPQLELGLSYPQIQIPVVTILDPLFVTVIGSGGARKILDLHLLKLAGTKKEIAGRNLITERFSYLSDPERQPAMHCIQDIREIHKNALSGFRPQINDRTGIFHGTDVGLKHQIKSAWI